MPKGYIRIPYHFVFHVNFYLWHKTCLVAAGHRKPDVPAEDIYSYVVSPETICIDLVLTV